MTLRCRSKGLLLATQKTAQAQRVYSSIKKTGEEKRAFSPQKKEEKQVKQTPTSAGKNRSRGDQK